MIRLLEEVRKRVVKTKELGKIPELEEKVQNDSVHSPVYQK